MNLLFRSISFIACLALCVSAWSQELQSVEEFLQSKDRENTALEAAPQAASGDSDEVEAKRLSFDDLPFTEYDLDFREWTDATGKFSVIGKFDGFDDGTVWLVRKDNEQRIEVKVEILAPKDRELLKSIKENIKSVEQIYVDELYADLERDVNQLCRLRDELEKLAANEDLDFEVRKAKQSKLILQMLPRGPSTYPFTTKIQYHDILGIPKELENEFGRTRKALYPDSDPYDRTKFSNPLPPPIGVIWPATRQDLRDVLGNQLNAHNELLFFALPKKWKARTTDLYTVTFENPVEDEVVLDVFAGVRKYGFNGLLMGSYLDIKMNPLRYNLPREAKRSDPPPSFLKNILSVDLIKYAADKKRSVAEDYNSFWDYIAEAAPLEFPSESTEIFQGKETLDIHETIPDLLRVRDLLPSDQLKIDARIVDSEILRSAAPFKLGESLSSRKLRLQNTAILRSQYSFYFRILDDLYSGKKYNPETLDRSNQKRLWLKTGNSWSYVEFHAIPTQTTDEFGRIELGKDELVYWCDPLNGTITEKLLTAEESEKVRQQLGMSVTTNSNDSP